MWVGTARKTVALLSLLLVSGDIQRLVCGTNGLRRVAARDVDSLPSFIHTHTHSHTHTLTHSLPGIVSMFHAPPDLCTAVSEEARLWETLGLDYFSPQPTKSQSEKETERLGTALKELQLKR